MARHPHWGHPDHDACGTGFVTRLGGRPSHDIVCLAVGALERLSHRGGVDADGASGDGTGLLTALPQKFFRARANEEGINLPERFGVGVVFLAAEREQEVREAIGRAAVGEPLRILGWRRVPVAMEVLGRRASEIAPQIWHFFVAPVGDDETICFESRLALLRKRAESLAPKGTYFCSLSSRTIVYKGLLSPRRLPEFYADLRDTRFETTFAVFHQRYSTNTQPSWNLAQPFRHIAHNGEINTIVGNRRWLGARERAIRSRLNVGGWFRALEENVSDSASFDNGFEIRLLEGQTPEEALLGMVPPAFEKDPSLSENVRATLESFCCSGEAWDGPAAMIFTDGQVVGAKLDRNGLRPMRYLLTRDGLLMAGSEAGLMDVSEARVAERQRLGPGEMLLANPGAGTFERWGQILDRVGRCSANRTHVPARRLLAGILPSLESPKQPKRTAAALGWTEDQFKHLFASLAEGKEADWSMGDDAPPAFVSSLHRTLWDYCKQRFAQVTNPPIDPLREAHVMSLDVCLRGSLGERLVLSSPVLGPGQLAEVFAACDSVRPIDFTFPAASGVAGAREALLRLAELPFGLCERPGAVLLSDYGVNKETAALPALLATAAVWKAMVAADLWDVPLIVETQQVLDTHHVALLLAAGATVVHPSLALYFAEAIAPGGAERFRETVDSGLRKVLARMGISTLGSYRNGHLFEVIGLEDRLCAEYFEDAAAYLGQKSLDTLLADSLLVHGGAFSEETEILPDAGLYRYRKRGERHASSPDVIRGMHALMKSPGKETFATFEALAEPREPVFVRDLLEFIPREPIPLEEVESEESILRRFSTQAMSLGSLSPEAHRTIALAMNELGARSNTGEGGEDPLLREREPAAANKIKQVASGRFGVTAEYLVAAEELEIKMAQGSKPGEGGQLPARKVTPFIARIRHAVAGTSLISPPPHHDIYSIEDLAQLIHDLRAINPRARIGVKLVSGAGVGIIAAGVAKAGADVITISGHSGGTGSSPLTSIKNTGLPWEIGLREAHETLTRAGLRDRVTLRVDGGLKFARDVLMAACLGASEFGFGTAALLAIGCVMARQCHLNTCPVGIATQDEAYRARFTGKPEMVVHYFRSLAGEIRRQLAQMGARSLTELSGAEGRLRPRDAADAGCLKPLLAVVPRATAADSEDVPARNSMGSSSAGELQEQSAVSGKTRVIRNSERSIGAHISGEWIRQHKTISRGSAGLGDVEYRFRGVAGQSFGAFLISGLTLHLTGEANDYVGKSLSGGSIVVTAGALASRRNDVLAGNTVLYGATSGQLFLAGRAGERFAVRNSGALAVAEGTGQHGCEYMTAGVAVILGSTGLNFGSGMTGGLAYLPDGNARESLNREMVTLLPLEEYEEDWLRLVLQKHAWLTGSPRAAELLACQDGLPLCRVQPKQLPCPIAQTWEPILAQLRPMPRVQAAEIVAQAARSALGA